MPSKFARRRPRQSVRRRSVGTWLAAALLAVVAAAGSADDVERDTETCNGSDLPAAPDEATVSRAASFHLEPVAGSLAQPWAMAFLSDDVAIVSERTAGRLTLVDLRCGTKTPIAGGPDDVFAHKDAGMHDVALHPDFNSNRWVYYAYVAGTETLSTTVVERARYADGRFSDRERLFEALPWYHKPIVYGGRLAFHDGYLFVTMGDRWNLRELSQSPGSHVGKVLRLNPDGTVPDDNPFVGVPGALPAVLSLGNRNAQGLAVQPHTGRIFTNEHGSQGGDEINVIEAGRNYGWPVISYGIEYDGEPIGDGLTRKEGMEQPLYYWVPSIAPSDLLFYTGNEFPGWQGNLFSGALAKTHLNRLVVEDDRVIHEERLLEDRGFRVRLVDQGPDGRLYIGIDEGTIYRLRPAEGR